MDYLYLSENYLAHYGRSKRDGAKIGSGRFRLGSGKNPRAASRNKKQYNLQAIANIVRKILATDMGQSDWARQASEQASKQAMQNAIETNIRFTQEAM